MINSIEGSPVSIKLFQIAQHFALLVDQSGFQQTPAEGVVVKQTLKMRVVERMVVRVGLMQARIRQVEVQSWIVLDNLKCQEEHNLEVESESRDNLSSFFEQTTGCVRNSAEF